MHEIGDPTSACPHCGAPRVWKYAKPDGRAWRRYCSSCHSARSYKSRVRRRAEYNRQIAERRRNNPLFRAYDMWKGAKERAARKGLEFSLSRKFVESRVLYGFCEVTGLQFDLQLKNKRMGSLSPSLDRKDPNLGYTEANTQVVCWLYNRAKADGPHSDVMLLVEALGAVKIARAA